MQTLDPFRLDRMLSEFAGRAARFARALKSSDAVEHVFESVPAGLDAELLSELSARSDSDPLAGASARWLVRLLVEHGNIERTRRVARSLRSERHPLDRPERGTFSVAEMRARMLADAPRRSAWFEAFAERAPGIGALVLDQWEHESHLYAELSSKPAALGGPTELVSEAAESWLASTAAPYAELGVRDIPSLVEAGLGTGVPGDFPRQLSARALGELFREGSWLRGINPELPELPRALGASSLLRALDVFGRALHAASENTGRPFVLTRDPEGLRVAAFGALFALLPLAQSFAERRLGVGRVRMADYRREMARVALVGARESALRATLAPAVHGSISAYRRSFEENVPRALGFEVPGAYAGAVFADTRGVVGFCGLLLGAARNAELIRTHDEDWFRNPRAIEEVRAELATLPAVEATQPALEAGSRELTALVTHGL